MSPPNVRGRAKGQGGILSSCGRAATAKCGLCSRMPRGLAGLGEGFGMKKFLLVGAALAAHIASPALAADSPVIVPTYEDAPPAPPPAVYSWWTGCYLGGHGGGAWGRPHYA